MSPLFLVLFGILVLWLVVTGRFAAVLKALMTGAAGSST